MPMVMGTQRHPADIVAKTLIGFFIKIAMPCPFLLKLCYSEKQNK